MDILPSMPPFSLNYSGVTESLNGQVELIVEWEGENCFETTWEIIELFLTLSANGFLEGFISKNVAAVEGRDSLLVVLDCSGFASSQLWILWSMLSQNYFVDDRLLSASVSCSSEAIAYTPKPPNSVLPFRGFDAPFHVEFQLETWKPCDLTLRVESCRPYGRDLAQSIIEHLDAWDLMVIHGGMQWNCCNLEEFDISERTLSHLEPNVIELHNASFVGSHMAHNLVLRYVIALCKTGVPISRFEVIES